MKHALKIVSGLLGALLLLLVVAAVGALLFIDPNDYRDTIAEGVEEQTGRKLAIEGEIQLSLFPWLGLELGAMELGNAAGFADKPFARIEGAEARVKLLPLLKLETEIDTVLLRGLVLNLHRRADGVSNWDDLVKAEPATDTSPDVGKPAAKTADKESEADSQKLEQILKALAIGGIILEEANVEWRDDLNKQQFALKHFNFSTGAIRIAEAIPIDLSTELSSTVPEIMGRVSFNGGVTADPLAERYRVDGMKLTAALSGKGLPGSSLNLSAGGDAAVDLAAQTASIRDFTLHGMGAEVAARVEVSKLMSQPDVEGMVNVKLSDVASLMKMAPADTVPPELNVTALNGSELQANLALSLGDQSLTVAPLKLNVSGLEMAVEAKGSQIIDSPGFSGKLDSNEFVPRQLLSDLGIALPEMADPSVLGKATLSTRFEGGLDRVALSQMELRFDDSRFSGKAAVSKFSTPVIRYTLDLDNIDVDRYLPPPGEEPVATEKVAAGDKAATVEPVEAGTGLPLEMLRSLDIDGTLTVGKVKVMNLHSNEILVTLKANKGKFNVHPLSAKLYKGGYSGNLGFDVSGKVARLSMDEKLRGVQSGPLLKDFMGKEYVTGKADLAAKLTARGLEAMAVRKSLNGNVSFKFENGTVNGINIGQLIRNSYATYKQQPKPPEEKKSTDFANISGNARVTNGLVSLQKLTARSPLFQVDGSGSVDLVSEKLNLLLATTIVSDIKDATGQRMGDMKGEKIPITIKGSFSEPRFGVDVASVLKARAQAELDKKKAEAQAELDRRKAEAEAQLEAEKRAAEAEMQKRIDEEKKELEKELQNKLKDMLKF